MPVTTRFSESLDKSYDEMNPSSPPPMSLTAQAISAASGSSGTTHSSPNGSISSYSRTNSVDSLDDSHSSSSGGCGGHSRQLSNDSSVNSGSDYIPTRSIKQATKLPHNPLQFVKTGTSQLCKKAAEQMKKSEEVKKLKPTEKEEPEEWQHNLDNWKSKRRQISQKTVERAEELRKLEEEEAERQARKKKNKTFSEMMQERSRRGSFGRKLSYFDDEDDNVNNFTENGWNKNNGESNQLHTDNTLENNKFTNDDCTDAPSMEKSPSEYTEDLPKTPLSPISNYKVNNLNGNANSMTKREVVDNHSSAENGSKQNLTSLPSEEYTFDKAIQSYVQYAENHQRKNMERRDHHKSNGIRSSRSDYSLDSRYLNDDASNCSSLSSVTSEPESVIERSGGTAMTIIAKIVKVGSEQRDFGFTTRSQGRGLVFVDTVASFGPADNAGLRRDDEILAVNGESVSNRSHSAIVFAIKQAVYTGCLELQIYRYNTEEALNMSQFPQSSKKKPSRVEERKAVFSREHSFERESTPEKKTFVREQSPRVDIRKRRSLFEGSVPETDRQQVRANRASDVSSLRGRIASFDSLKDAHESKTHIPLARKQEEFKEKLRSFEKIERPDTRSDKRSSIDRFSQFRSRLESFEKVEPNTETEKEQFETRKQQERKQSLKEKLAMFERQENFERSRSCDLLDVGRGQDDEFDISKNVLNRVDDLAWIDAAHSEDVGPPRIIDVMTKESSPEPNSNLLRNTVPREDNEEKESKEQKPVIEDVMVKKILPNNTAKNKDESLHNSDDFMPSVSNNQKSGFELAESLEETPIISSNPSSPFQKKRPSVNSESTDSVNERDFIQEIENQLVEVEEISPKDNPAKSEMLKRVTDQDNFDNFDDLIDAPPRLTEPPKEKPPPPPQEDLEATPDQLAAKLRRAESTKRIRKQTWQRRSDFLGIDPNENPDYLDVEVAKPPLDLESILRAEKSLDDKLRKTSLNGLDSWNKNDDIDSPKLTNGNGNIKTNEDDDIARKEREIIENLEREEKEKQTISAFFDDDPQERLEEERLMSELDLLQEERFRLDEVRKLHEREKKLRQHESFPSADNDRQQLTSIDQEQVRIEKEKLRREQEALKKEKEEYQKQVQQYQQKYSPAIRRKNVILLQQSGPGNNQEKALPPLSPSRTRKSDSNSFKPLNNKISETPRTAEKKFAGTEIKERDEVIKLSRNPGSDSKGKQQQQEVVGKPDSGQKNDNRHQPMTKNTLHTISALPKAKLTDSEKWIARRKPEATRRDPSTYNQHWLIQEAEMRRINDQQNRLRQAKSPTRHNNQKPPPPQQSFYQTRPDKLVLDSHHNSRQVAKNYEDVSARNVHERNDYSELNVTPIPSPPKNYSAPSPLSPLSPGAGIGESQMLSVSGKKKCSHCAEELGRGAAMIIESLQLYYHIHCFKCCVCHVQLGNGLSGADVRVRNQKLHCHNCYSNDEAGLKFSKV